ncbi:hypothetical protein KCP76_22080 [Salmonella enterica subsp. enterica serovar Weltevreden]|nr:hypothetical protein KCP76_22080 [Salmonella enterica subsp. enterica serovar Weltevreden]
MALGAKQKQRLAQSARADFTPQSHIADEAPAADMSMPVRSLHFPI